MGLVKHASAQIVASADDLRALDDRVIDPKLRLGSQRIARLHNVVAASDPALLDPRRFLYLRVRAISAGEWWGPNDNGDYFEDEELLRRHGTFVYCPSYVDHVNLNSADAIGIVIASVYHPGPSPGGWVEIIQAIDRERASAVRVAHLAGQPDLLTAIRTGQVTDTSMGCFVQYSVCSIPGCRNVARDISDYCTHIANFKGRPMDVGGQRLVPYEENHGVTFFENSVISTRIDHGGGGADINAKILSEVASKQLQKVASHNGHHWTELLVDRLALCHEQESAMSHKPKTAAPVNGPDAREYFFTVGAEDKTTQVDTGDYPAKSGDNKDAALFDQSQGTSQPSPPPTIIDRPEEKLSQQQGEVDYPLPGSAGNVPEPPTSPGNIDKVMSRKKRAEADPSNLIGGPPDEVKDAEQAIEEAEAERAQEHQDPEDVERTEESMEGRHDAEDERTEISESKQDMGATIGQRLRRSVAKILGITAADVQDGEGVRVLQDYIRTARAQIDTYRDERAHTVSASARKNLTGRINRLQIGMNRAIARVTHAATDPVFNNRLNKLAEQFGGNPQSLVDFDDIYEQPSGGPDKALFDESKGKSDKEPPAAVGRGENVSQEPSADDHPPDKFGATLSSVQWHRPKKQGGVVKVTAKVNGVRRVIAAGAQAEALLDKIVGIMDSQGLGYDEAEKKALSKMNPRKPVHPAGKAAASSRRNASGGQPELTGSRAALQARLQAATKGGSMPRRNTQAARPEYAFMTDADIDGRRMARGEPYNMGKGSDDPRGGGTMDPETALQGGNKATLNSPSTSDVTGGGDEFVRGGDKPSNRKIQPYEGQRRRMADFSVGQEVKWKPGAPYADPAEVGVIESIEGDSAEVDWGVQKGYVKVETTPLDYIDPVTARRQPIMAAEDADERMKTGTDDMLESPSTSDVAGDGNETESRKSEMDTMNTTVEAREHILSGRDALIARQRERIKQLEAQTRQAAMQRRKQQAMTLVRQMAEKGMFVKAGNALRQRTAADREFRRLCKLHPVAFAEAAKQVTAAQKGTRVPEFTQTVPTRPRQGAVNQGVPNQRVAARSSDEQALGTMFL